MGSDAAPAGFDFRQFRHVQSLDAPSKRAACAALRRQARPIS
jgi:hypothetical protein